MEKLTKEKFIERLLKINEEELPYKIVGEYSGTTKNILIENNYGICSVRANHLLNGVIPGIESAINKTEYWINKAIEIHGNLYPQPQKLII